jgi:5-methyltetrahydrofolate--homocysteine methyltransferase
LWPMGISAIGANCGQGLSPVAEALRQMREVLPDAPLVAKPNAGLPKLVDGETVYDVGPREFAERVSEFVALGARIVGSCCGSSPPYTAAIAEALSAGG